MAIHYTCRHCDISVGKIDEQIGSDMLGFNHLTSAERADMLTYEANGDIYVKVICEDCHETLTRNPEFYEVDQIIQ